MKQFIKEAKETSISDILLILSDQRDLYTDEEIAILEDELLSRDVNTKDLEKKELELIDLFKWTNSHFTKRQTLKAIFFRRFLYGRGF